MYRNRRIRLGIRHRTLRRLVRGSGIKFFFRDCGNRFFGFDYGGRGNLHLGRELLLLTGDWTQEVTRNLSS